MAFHSEIGCTVMSSNANISKVHIEARAVPAQKVEVVWSGLDRHDVRFRITRSQPEDTYTDVGAAVDNQRLFPRIDDLAIKLFGKMALWTLRQVILGLAKTLIDNDLIAPPAVFDSEFALPVGDASDLMAFDETSRDPKHNLEWPIYDSPDGALRKRIECQTHTFFSG
jgi:hypothetical protein